MSLFDFYSGSHEEGGRNQTETTGTIHHEQVSLSSSCLFILLNSFYVTDFVLTWLFSSSLYRLKKGKQLEKEEAIVEVKKNIHLIKAPHAGMSRQIVKLYSKSYDPVQGIWIHDIDFSTHEVLVYLTIADITDTYAHCTVPLTGCCNWNDSVWIIWNKKPNPVRLYLDILQEKPKSWKTRWCRSYKKMWTWEMKMFNLVSKGFCLWDRTHEHVDLDLYCTSVLESNFPNGWWWTQ